MTKKASRSSYRWPRSLAATDATLKAKRSVLTQPRAVRRRRARWLGDEDRFWKMTTRFYAENAVGQVGQIPPSAVKLMETIAPIQRAKIRKPPLPGTWPPAEIPWLPATTTSPASLSARRATARWQPSRAAVVTAARRCLEKLFSAASGNSIGRRVGRSGCPTLERYNSVAGDLGYRTLSERPGIQEYPGLCRRNTPPCAPRASRCSSCTAAVSGGLNLPPPPIRMLPGGGRLIDERN